MQVCLAADDALGALLPQQPLPVCLALLKANLPTQGSVNTPACQPTPLIQVPCCLANNKPYASAQSVQHSQQSL